MRVSLYCRVSTDEQAKHGLSIDTQIANLRAWAQEHNHTVVAEYVDAGISGKKPYSKRPALAEFLANCDGVDALVFTKLDRFFRSVKLYYQAVAIMEQHKVAWIATQEDYETVTSAGRFKVNIMLSVAESEADRTSERIKVVLDEKKARHEAVTGHVPVGYRIEGKSIVIDEEKAAAVRALYRAYRETGVTRRAEEISEAETGYHWSHAVAIDSLRNRSYYGFFYGIEGYAPAIISQQEWEDTQELRKHWGKRPQRTTYIFCGIIRCGVCGGSYGGNHPMRDDKSKYFCRRHSVYRCTNKTIVWEKTVEAFLLDTLEDDFNTYINNITLRDTSDSERQEAALKRKEAKLRDLYMEDMISLEDLKAQKADIDRQLRDLVKPEAISIDAMREVLTPGWKTLYAALDNEGKRRWWRTLLREIRIYPDRHIEYDFR